MDHFVEGKMTTLCDKKAPTTTTKRKSNGDPTSPLVTIHLRRPRTLLANDEYDAIVDALQQKNLIAGDQDLDQQWDLHIQITIHVDASTHTDHHTCKCIYTTTHTDHHTCKCIYTYKSPYMYDQSISTTVGTIRAHRREKG